MNTEQQPVRVAKFMMPSYDFKQFITRQLITCYSCLYFHTCSYWTFCGQQSYVHVTILDTVIYIPKIFCLNSIYSWGHGCHPEGPWQKIANRNIFLGKAEPCGVQAGASSTREQLWGMALVGSKGLSPLHCVHQTTPGISPCMQERHQQTGWRSKEATKAAGLEPLPCKRLQYQGWFSWEEGRLQGHPTASLALTEFVLVWVSAPNQLLTWFFLVVTDSLPLSAQSLMTFHSSVHQSNQFMPCLWFPVTKNISLFLTPFQSPIFLLFPMTTQFPNAHISPQRLRKT